MGVRKVRIEPLFRHALLGCFAIGDLQECHGEGLDIECRVREGALTGKTDQIPVDEHKIVGSGVADKQRVTPAMLRVDIVILLCYLD